VTGKSFFSVKKTNLLILVLPLAALKLLHVPDEGLRQEMGDGDWNLT